ncbi:MAG: exodeoxyribonuclease I [bacterium]
MGITRSFYWHDYETSGINPRCDRVMQFAGIRTDLEFNIIGKPLEIFCKPADDFLPHPEACLVTGITPQHAREHGVTEAECFQAINEVFSEPGTCALGYNTLRFDDEFSRYGFYRNFIDPYAREWQNGNSRWDIIDLARLTHALRPDGIEWPKNEKGDTSFRLELLTAANGISHQGAHDALVDVRATIAFAQLIKSAQPRLFDYVFNNRGKRQVDAKLDVTHMDPVVHVSARYPARLGCIAVVAPVAQHPTNKNAVLVYDLREDPSFWVDRDVDEIRERIFTASENLPEGQRRIPIKNLSINKAPIVVPTNTLTGEVREKWQLDAEAELRHLEILRNVPGLAAKLAAVFSGQTFEESNDPDQNLYGGFINDHDRRLCDSVLAASPQQLASMRPGFQDQRLDELLFRYRARNWPETLASNERQQWESFRMQRLNDDSVGITLRDYRKRLSLLTIDPELSDEDRQIVNALLDWPMEIGVS